MIAAIPTLYNGVQFRSRLEARWAAFFDSYGLKWSYEPLDLSGWIPDFMLKPSKTPPMLIEIKPLSDATSLKRDTKEKIIRALSSVVRSDELPPHYVNILGVDPSIGWSLSSDAGWRFRSDIFSSSESWEAHWKSAGNAVQWKKPQMFGAFDVPNRTIPNPSQSLVHDVVRNLDRRRASGITPKLEQDLIDWIAIFTGSPRGLSYDSVISAVWQLPHANLRKLADALALG